MKQINEILKECLDEEFIDSYRSLPEFNLKEGDKIIYAGSRDLDFPMKAIVLKPTKSGAKIITHKSYEKLKKDKEFIESGIINAKYITQTKSNRLYKVESF